LRLKLLETMVSSHTAEEVVVVIENAKTDRTEKCRACVHRTSLSKTNGARCSHKHGQQENCHTYCRDGEQPYDGSA